MNFAFTVVESKSCDSHNNYAKYKKIPTKSVVVHSS